MKSLKKKSIYKIINIIFAASIIFPPVILGLLLSGLENILPPGPGGGYIVLISIPTAAVISVFKMVNSINKTVYKKAVIYSISLAYNVGMLWLVIYVFKALASG